MSKRCGCSSVGAWNSWTLELLMEETAKANGLDSYDYLLYALSVLPYYETCTSHEMLEITMPWSSEVQ